MATESKNNSPIKPESITGSTIDPLELMAQSSRLQKSLSNISSMLDDGNVWEALSSFNAIQEDVSSKKVSQRVEAELQAAKSAVEAQISNPDKIAAFWQKASEALNTAEQAINNGDLLQAKSILDQTKNTILSASEISNRKVRANTDTYKRYTDLVARLDSSPTKPEVASENKKKPEVIAPAEAIDSQEPVVQRQQEEVQADRDPVFEAQVEEIINSTEALKADSSLTLADLQSFKDNWLKVTAPQLDVAAGSDPERKQRALTLRKETNQTISNLAATIFESQLNDFQLQTRLPEAAGGIPKDKQEEEFVKLYQELKSNITLLHMSPRKNELEEKAIKLLEKIQESASTTVSVKPDTKPSENETPFEKLKKDPPSEIKTFQEKAAQLTPAMVRSLTEDELQTQISDFQKSFKLVQDLYLDEKYGEFRGEREFGKIKAYLESIRDQTMQILFEVWSAAIEKSWIKDAREVLVVPDITVLSEAELQSLLQKTTKSEELVLSKSTNPNYSASQKKYLEELQTSLKDRRIQLESTIHKKEKERADEAEYQTWRTGKPALVTYTNSIPSQTDLEALSPRKRSELQKSIKEFMQKNAKLLASTNNEKIKIELEPINRKLQSAIETIARNSQGEISSVTLESHRDKPLEELMHEWFTLSIQHGGEAQLAFFKVLKEHLADMKDSFLEHGHHLHLPEAESLRLWSNFTKLCETTAALTDFGVIRADALDTNELTANHEKLLGAASKDGAMKYNSVLNNLEIVGARNVNPGTQFSESAGLIQKMAFAAFQEMCKPLPQNFSNPQPKESVFSRNNGFTETTASKLIKYISEKNEVVLAEGMPEDTVVVGIQNELAKYPHEAQEIIQMIAKWKITRDDLGTKAGIWHLGRNKGAFKFANGGTGKPAGLLASIMYNVGKNSVRDNHAAMLYFIDPRNTQLFLNPRRESYKDYPVSNDPQKMDKERMDKEVVRLSEELQEFRKMELTSMGECSFKKFTPENWYEDFPALDDFFNQHVDARTAPQYIQSRDAVLKILELAAAAPLEVFQTITDQMKEKMVVQVQTFGSQIGKALSYIPSYSLDDAKCPPKYRKLHELILAAYQFYLSSLLMSIPGRIPLSSFILGTVTKREYDELYQVGLDTMITVIDQNSTLSGYYQENTTGKRKDGSRVPDAFLLNPNLKRRWRDEHKLRNVYQRWRLDNNPELKNSSTLNKAKILDTPPHDPTNVSEGWKTSYEDPGVKRG